MKLAKQERAKLYDDYLQGYAAKLPAYLLSVLLSVLACQQGMLKVSWTIESPVVVIQRQ